MAKYEYEIRYQGIATNLAFISYIQRRYEKYFYTTVEDTSYIYPDGVRIIEASDGFKTKMKKKVLESRFLPGRKFALSFEEEVDLATSTVSETDDREMDKEVDESTSSPQFIRRRKRDIYHLPQGIELHITQINRSEAAASYELELDYESDSPDEKENFLKEAEAFNAEVRGPLGALTKFVRIFNGPDRNDVRMSSKTISKPGDMMDLDFITMMKRGEVPRGIPEGYTLTIKGDGYQRMLCLINKNLFIVGANKVFIPLEYNYNFSEEEFIILGEHIEGSEDGGERVDRGDTSPPPPPHPIFAPFDILHWSRHNDVRNHPNHLERMSYVEDITERYTKYISRYLTIYHKPFINVGQTPEAFAKAYKKVRTQSYPFEDDGLILTPIPYSHNPTPLQSHGRRDMLYLAPSTCKLKPKETQSIDFRVDFSTRSLYTSDSDTPYKGSERYPFDSKTQVDWSSFDPVLDGRICEFLPIFEDDKFQYFKFTRERVDKVEPNYRSVADKNWDLINKPLAKGFYTAKGIPRLRLQNNTIKRNLIKSLPKGCLVVDIGTGFGGDIRKYNGIAHSVICIEPYETNRIELIKRLKVLQDDPKTTTRYIVLDCGGEDTETIMDTFRAVRSQMLEAPVAVTSMLSMTFFWKNKDFLGKFKNTLRSIAGEGGLGSTSPPPAFYFYTIEGHRFLKYFKENDNKIKNTAIIARYNPKYKDLGVGIPGKVEIAIPDSILPEPQTEYLVDLDDLKDVLVDLKTEDGLLDTYLTKDEMDYAKVHVFGSARIRS